METLYWHDYETFGTNAAKDRLAQFAGLRTDTELNIIGESLIEYCQITPDIIPHPGACLVTGIVPQLVNKEGIPENEFIAKIYEEFSEPGTCTVGFNSCNFDDEFTRYALYRNFYNPYDHHSEKSGNSRWDLINVVRLFRAIHPDGPIVWPKKEDGKYSTRLEDLTRANGIEHSQAHDALGDVKATIALARLLRQHHPKLFDYCYKHRVKSLTNELLGVEKRKLANPKPLLHVDSFYGKDRNYLAVVYPVAKHPTKGNSVIVYNILEDPAPLLELSARELREKLFTKKEDRPEGEKRVSMHEINANKCPVLVPLSMVSAASRKHLGIDKNLCIDRIKQINEKSDVPFVAQAAYQRGFEPRTDPEQMLYDGFFEKKDKKIIETVRKTAPSKLKNTVFGFEDKRLPELLFRYRARNFPKTLDAEEKKRWRTYCESRWKNPDLTSITLDEFYEFIVEKLEDKDLDKDKKKILVALHTYGKKTFK